MMRRALAIANRKGGVGKTTTAVNLAAALAAGGDPVLLVDLDPQGNASTAYGIQPDARSGGSYDLLMNDTPLADLARDTMVPGLRIVPAHHDLAGAEIELAQGDRPTARLARALVAESEPGWVIVDCPPSLGLLTLNALNAVDAVLIPLQAEYYALEGLSQMLKIVEQVRQRTRKPLGVEGILLTMVDRRNRLAEQVSSDVRRAMGPAVFETTIPRNTRLSEAPSHGLPALLYDLRCPGSQAYIALARELRQRRTTQGKG